MVVGEVGRLNEDLLESTHCLSVTPSSALSAQIQNASSEITLPTQTHTSAWFYILPFLSSSLSIPPFVLREDLLPSV